MWGDTYALRDIGIFKITRDDKGGGELTNQLHDFLRDISVGINFLHII